ncbi:MAG: methyltransferase domain-containing protein [Deltaproteobacteria bacterium]|nr:methyltransferase domain-containing protein [Deltaproteobacteria bacterium]
MKALNDRDQINKRAVDADCLHQRILKNTEYQKINLVEWIFERLHLDPGSRVLELCSGTGNQTLRMIELVGTKGFVVATDISEDALRQLREKVDKKLSGCFTTVAASMDELQNALEKSGLEKHRFDMVFCAYGLYYSTNAEQVLEDNLYRLKNDGRMVVVGPFGPNNDPLFKVLEESVVVPFACRRFTRNTIHTLVNPVEWKSPDDVIQYWRNTTFFDEKKLDTVQRNVQEHFERNDNFINEKWVMMIVMGGKRVANL